MIKEIKRLYRYTKTYMMPIYTFLGLAMMVAITMFFVQIASISTSTQSKASGVNESAPVHEPDWLGY